MTERIHMFSLLKTSRFQQVYVFAHGFRLINCSAINQQIALRMIKKFGFSCNAVWNGKEALGYLLKEPSPEHPKPDIILMDVQMPVMSGYSATHRIRHHKPYTTMENVRSIPILAMTASAIQGDKEKCQRAGMDDYLAKPVNGKTLESMLLKWAPVGRNPELRVHSKDNSECTDPEHERLHRSASETEEFTPDCSERSEAARPPMESNALPRIDSEGAMSLQSADTEEKATYLRDYKLLAATEARNNAHSTPISPEAPAVRPHPPPTALTEENMGRLDRELDESLPIPKHSKLRGSSLSGGHSSMEFSHENSPVGSTLGELVHPGLHSRHESWMRAVRKRLSRNDSDQTQRTVTPSTRDD